EGQKAAFTLFNEKLRLAELDEIDTKKENDQLDRVGHSLDGKYSKSVKRPGGRILEVLRDKVVSMEKAPGVGLGKYLEKLLKRKKIAKDQAKDDILREISQMRTAYSEFTRNNIANILDNYVVHSDPHSGNFSWDLQ